MRKNSCGPKKYQAERPRFQLPLYARHLVWGFVVIACGSANSLGDTIRLIDDSILHGQIKSFESGAFLFVDSSDKQMEIPLRNCLEWSIGTPDNATSNSITSGWAVQLKNGGMVHGAIEAISDSRCVVRTESRMIPKLEIPLKQVLSCLRIAANETRTVNESNRDIVVTQVAPTRSIEVSGQIVQLDKERLLFEFQGKERSIRLEKINAIYPAKEGEASREPFFLGRFSDTLLIPVTIETTQDESIVLRTLWGKRIEIPKDSFGVFSVRNGRLEFLSNLNPLQVTEVAFFDRTIAWQEDRALDGSPLVLGGIPYSKGIACHSHCELTYALEDAYERLFVTVGIDDRKRKFGNADVAVYVNEKEIYRNYRLNESNSPIELDLPLQDAQQLKLITRFGDDQDVGDEVIWANARLRRK